MEKEEHKRIRDYIQGQVPLRGYVTFSVNADDSTRKLLLIKEVVTVISKFNNDYWPSDEQWDLLLPTWFLNKIKSHSLEEITKNATSLWDYGSWLDAMKYRGWEWYSSRYETTGFTIILEPNSLPFSVNPLEYVIYETGVSLKNIIFNERYNPG